MAWKRRVGSSPIRSIEFGLANAASSLRRIEKSLKAGEFIDSTSLFACRVRVSRAHGLGAASLYVP